VFSPYYALARRRGRPDPENFCALNVALYGATGHRWTMTERPAGAVRRSGTVFEVGPSALAWEGDELVFRINEVTVPWPSRIRGTIRVHPVTPTGRAFTLTPDGRHRWWPIAPEARVEVALERPALAWKGRGYLDANGGSEPLEDGFKHWHWSRAPLPDGTAILYDMVDAGGENRALALRIGASGAVDHVPVPETVPLPTTFWRMRRATRAEGEARVTKTLEDAPFYARSLVTSTLFGAATTAVHESLSLDRFRQPWVQLMLPFRMPRARR